MPFTGNLRLKVIEAQDLKPNKFSVRHNPVVGKTQQMLIDPYVDIAVDEIRINRSTTKQRTFKPLWNECFVNGAQNLLLTVFHDTAIPPDEFVANCSISFDDLLDEERSGVHGQDIWLDLEPSGKRHVSIELRQSSDTMAVREKKPKEFKETGTEPTREYQYNVTHFCANDSRTPSIYNLDFDALTDNHREDMSDSSDYTYSDSDILMPVLEMMDTFDVTINNKS